MKRYERSTHDLGYIWRSSMSSGTLVPFMSEVGLPGDSFDIDLNCEVLTLPTTGPLFGSFKVQLDVFECPVRLYNGTLHMNMLNIGMDMSQILLPQMTVKADYVSGVEDDNSQISPSSIYSYLNMRGVGRMAGTESGEVERMFNAVPYLGYWDVYKNYYANKQEERGYVIHNSGETNTWLIDEVEIAINGNNGITSETLLVGQIEDVDTSAQGGANPIISAQTFFTWDGTGLPYGTPDVSKIEITVNSNVFNLTEIFNVNDITVNANGTGVIASRIYTKARGNYSWRLEDSEAPNVISSGQGEPQLEEFALTNIDDMRMDILADVRSVTPFVIDENTQAPYGLGLGTQGALDDRAMLSSQEGLGIKTYQSDLFNNWISTEWIDGTNGINEVTAVSTTGDEFTIDALNLANKVYNMLNRIAISGGSYDDWLDAVYTHERAKSTENPIYHGSLIKELGFEDKVVIGYIGSFVKYEGLDLLLEACAILKEKHGDIFRLLLVGDGDTMQQLRRTTQFLQLEDQVVFTGRVSHDKVQNYYSLIDIAPLPRKGLRVCELVSPLKPFEAMGSGKVL
ncbi:MAG: glycosyltransferase, partial [Methylophagaceae bacterium]